LDLRKNPPAVMTFVFKRIGKVNKGEWFIPPSGNTVYLWNFTDTSKKEHPVYDLSYDAIGE